MYNHSMQANIIFLLAALLTLCNEYGLVLSNPMVGEDVRNAHDGEFPYVASVKRYNPNNIFPEDDHICSGVLISNRDVLTVDHCSRHFANQITEVVLGSNDIWHGEKYYASWWLSYQQWAAVQNIEPRYTNNDITIIRLNQTVAEHINPIPLSTVTDPELFRKVVQVAAFGKTATGAMSRLMETVQVTIITRRECDHRISRLRGSPFKTALKCICGVADPVVLMSHGNSGGAVVLNGELIGIHKGTSPSIEIQYHPHKVNVFMSINFYIEYIVDVLLHF